MRDRGNHAAVAGEVLDLSGIEFPDHPAAWRENQNRTPSQGTGEGCPEYGVRSRHSRFDGVISATKLLLETLDTERLLEGRDIKVYRAGSIPGICRIPHIHHEFARVAVWSEWLETRRVGAEERNPSDAEAASWGGQSPYTAVCRLSGRACRHSSGCNDECEGGDSTSGASGRYVSVTDVYVIQFKNCCKLIS